ncbi:MAG TPA: toprim domain-containing protein [Puia sp.]|nr:toprim domain-containing protein [Puia sp.]
MNHHISCREAKQQDLVAYLERLGHLPKRVKGDDYWYLSPLREESDPSFKVNKKFNIWYDHGLGKGGNLIDFGVLYYGCTVKELLQRLDNHSSFQQPPSGSSVHPTQKSVAKEESKISILSATEINSPLLIEYLNTRKISLDIARKYCRQVAFQLYGKQITAIGFPNRSGGYELRNGNFKGSSSPKDITYIDNGQPSVAVFEGFFSYLSFHQLTQQQPTATNMLVLNSLAFLEKSRSLMEQHQAINLYLDRDRSGQQLTEKALQWDRRYIDQRALYCGHKDLNEWLQHQSPSFQQRHKRKKGRSL